MFYNVHNACHEKKTDRENKNQNVLEREVIDR